MICISLNPGGWEPLNSWNPVGECVVITFLIDSWNRRPYEYYYLEIKLYGDEAMIYRHCI